MDSMERYLGTTLDGRYEIAELIGTGGMAIVFKAMCNRLNRYVAVKVLRDDMAEDDDFRSSFQVEAKAVAMLSHPNIVSVYDVSHNDEINYIVMELIDGITVKQYMKKKGTLGWKEALFFTTQICKALEHAHSKGVVHRDIKPQNIMILKDGTIKVADFGISALESASEQKAEQTVGSVHYIAPEQAKGGAPDIRSDIYSLGVVMYEMLTGSLPYDGDDTEDVARKHIGGGARTPSEVNPAAPEELSRITMKAMCPDIEKRYQNATELLNDLEEYRKQQNFMAIATTAQSEQEDFDKEFYANIIPDVVPISNVGELSREKYKLRKARARKVSMLSGAFGVLIFIVALFTFLWSFWIKDIFSAAERVQIPDFIGTKYDSIVNNGEFNKTYNFIVKYTIDPAVPDGEILSQDPLPGRSMMVVPNKIDVTLTISTGIVMKEVPNVVGMQYQEATLEIQKAGFVAETVYESSEDVAEDYVIKSNPGTGEQLSSGSTVYISVSSGPTLKEVTMPNLVGLTEAKAKERLKAVNLTYVDSKYTYSDNDAGIVVKQSTEAYTSVEEYSKIYLWVSLGPKP
ncbi:MAG: Stk1 family PASTA domain-containing Ser/Thr kinase [Ruminococcaceae bacterium]|nr:Stk1 family PASTA domain-containing Ser/Thr kinase [Oscillospiraceae bacterium]